MPSRWRCKMYSRSNSATAANTGEHKLAGGRGRVDGLFAADELYMFFGQSFHEIKQVARVSCEPADGFYDNRVTAPDVFHHAGKLWAVGVFAACLFDENLVNTKFTQQDFLTRSVLFLGADADVSNLQICSSIHCNRVTARFDIFQNFENNPIDIVFRCFRWV